MVLAILLLLSLGACASEPAPQLAESEEPAEEAQQESAPPEGNPYATMETKEGPIEIRLRPDLAPQAVANFIRLAELGFYYNSLFHRVIPGTIIQGGDPNSKDNDPYNDGQGNSGTYLPAEFSDQPFQRGTVAMARQPADPNSASCQFFICLKRMPQWDGEYTIFGEVTKGIELVEEMSNAPRSKNPRLKDRPAGNLTIRHVTIEYRQE